MFHLIKYSYKFKMRNFVTMFWPLVFPLILGLFFKLGLENVGTAETMGPVSAAVVIEEKNEYSQVFYDFLKGLEDRDKPVLKIKRTSEKKALEMLRNKEVRGIYYIKENPVLSVNSTDYYSNILEILLKGYIDNKNILMEIKQTHPEKFMEAATSMETYENYIKNVSVDGEKLDFSVMFFYALIGMACMYGGFIGYYSVSKLQANLTAVGARRCVTPTNKMKLILCELFTAFTMHFMNLLIDIYVFKYIFDIQLSGSMWAMVLVVFLGSLIGVSFGVCVTSVGKWSENVKIGLILAFAMIGSTFAGLYNNKIKFSIDQNIPVINRINPVSLISDSFYCINVYNDGNRLAENLVILFMISCILILISFLAVRRECYDSI